MWWSSNSGIGAGLIRDVDHLNFRILVHPDQCVFPLWLSMGTRGLHLFPELDLTTPMPRRSDYA